MVIDLYYPAWDILLLAHLGFMSKPSAKFTAVMLHQYTINKNCITNKDEIVNDK